MRACVRMCVRASVRAGGGCGTAHSRRVAFSPSAACGSALTGRGLRARWVGGSHSPEPPESPPAHVDGTAASTPYSLSGLPAVWVCTPVCARVQYEGVHQDDPMVRWLLSELTCQPSALPMPSPVPPANPEHDALAAPGHPYPYFLLASYLLSVLLTARGACTATAAAAAAICCAADLNTIK